MVNKPNWVPKNAGKEFTTSVLKGVGNIHDGLSKKNRLTNTNIIRRKSLSIDDYVNGVLSGNRTIIARTITLIESNSPKHFELSQKVLKKLLPFSGNSIRIGITGVPGAGKSTFIEALGNKLIKENHKIAVLAVDPTSSITKGSVLGDKTRMEVLSRNENCFIRPSPSAGKLGGVTRKTRETIVVCEAAGFDIILVETVGVGQNEITVRSLVDYFLLLKIAGAGDELQGIKKGVIELADALVINKADGDNVTRAEIARQEFSRALHYLKSPTEGWNPQVFKTSATQNEGIDEVWENIMLFKDTVQKNNFFYIRRNKQLIAWVHTLIKENLYNQFYRNDDIIKHIPMIENKVLEGKIPPTFAAQKLLEIYKNIIHSNKGITNEI